MSPRDDALNYPQKVCPAELEIAIWFVTRCEPWTTCHPESGTYRRVVADFLRRGYLVPASPGLNQAYSCEYEATDGLRMWVLALCEVNRPRQSVKWEIPR